jgi:hypothetical protein
VNPGGCPREVEVARAVLAHPLGSAHADDPLMTHARECPACAEVLMVASVFAPSRDRALCEAHVPAAGQVWWRAALRAHAEAGRAARRPFVWPVGLAGACALALIAAWLKAFWPQMYDWVRSLSLELPRGSDASTMVALSAILVGALLLGLAPVAVYWACSDRE